MFSEPTFSIILPSMGRGDLLHCLLNSLHQHASRAYDICIGFDPTGDDPLEFFRRYEDYNLFPTIWLRETVFTDGLSTIRWKVAKTPGMSAAVNTAAWLARGDWFVWLCDDFVALPGWDDFSFGLREDRVLCFELLEPLAGSFPPAVDAGDSPQNYNAYVPVLETHRRWSNSRDKRTTPGGFFGSALIHRSKWIPWPEWCDPYSVNDISWFWELHRANPDLAFGRMLGNCLYHFTRQSVKHFGLEAPGDTDIRFTSHYGLTIQEAYDRIYIHSRDIWRDQG